MNLHLRYSVSAIFFATLLILFSCSGNNGADPRIGFTFPSAADYSTITWTDAFRAAHNKFSREYAFGDWKGMDWDSLYNQFAPRISAAQAAGDSSAYYLALHEYVCSLPDGHVSLSPANSAVPTALSRALIGGGYGMAIAELDGGRVVAAAVSAGGPASLAGVVAGAEIIAWGGEDPRAAIGRINVAAIPYKNLSGAAGGECPPATTEHYRLEQARLLTRGTIGATVQIVFKNPGAAVQTKTLTAVDDAGATFSLLDFAKRPDFSDQVDYRILPEGFGYVLVRMELDLSGSGYPAGVFQKFQEAITAFVAAGVSGVILDVRGNYGGSDVLASDLCGFFHAAPSFYEYQEFCDTRTGKFLRITFEDSDAMVDNLRITPQVPHFGGPVVVLVNPNTKSSGEGMPMGISRLPQGHVIGFHGTNGSFGMVGGKITMPGGYEISYPFGRSVDANGVVQLDSHNGTGGVAPNPRVPKTLTNVLAYAAGTDVELQYAVTYLQTH